MPVTSQQVEWLSLVETIGPFLTVQVLEQAFPQGLESVETPRRQQLRSAYEEWRDAVDEDDELLPALHDAWINLVLSELLGYDAESLTAASGWRGAPPTVSPCDGTATFGPSWIVHSLGSSKARLFIKTVPPGTRLDSVANADGWLVSEIERMTLLCRAHGVRLGLVTNGEEWVLVNAPLDSPSGQTTWYSHYWLQEPATLRAFQSLLGVRRCFGPTEATLEALLDESLKHQDEVTDTLGEQVRRATEVLIQALDKADEDRDRDLLQGVSPSTLYEAGLTVMMRLVFSLCAEERGLFLLGDPIYDQNLAVSTLRGQLAEEADQYGEEVLERRYDAWARLLSVFRSIFAGIEHEDLRIPAMGGSLFDPDRYPFLEGRPSGTSWEADASHPLPIDNRTVLLLLNSLQVLEHSHGALALSYRALDVEQIGHVYEGLLEHTATRAPTVVLGLKGSSKIQLPNVQLSELESASAHGQMRLIQVIADQTGRTEAAIKRDLQKPLRPELTAALRLATSDENLRERILPYGSLLRVDAWGELVVYRPGAFIVAVSGNRRVTGTHYTPKTLTEAVVASALEPLIWEPSTNLNQERVLKSSSALLGLSICDPAMGSGAFLVQACRALAERVAQAWAAEELEGKRISSGGLSMDDLGEAEPLGQQTDERLATARRLVAENCLYGVDINPMAVELAKLSIWLVTLAKDRPFGFLDHNLKTGDSLLGIHHIEQLVQFSMTPTQGTFQPTIFSQKVEDAVSEATALRLELRSIPMRSAVEVREMARLNAEAIHRIEAVNTIADVIVGTSLEHGIKSPTTKQVMRQLATQVDDLVSGDAQALLRASEIASSALSHGLPPGDLPRRPFHWTMEFPEVFDRTSPGFDCIVSNPPYVSYYGRDSIAGSDSAVFTRFATALYSEIDSEDVLSGRINLFLLFLTRYTQLLGKGTCGVVLPDTIVTNESYSKMRAALTKSGRVRRVIQYDTPQFRNATVGTAVVLMGAPRPEGDVRLDLSSAGEHSVSVTEALESVARRTNCSWLPITSSEMRQLGLPMEGTAALADFADVRDGINTGSKITRHKLITAVDDGDPALRPCMEGKWISPFVIQVGSLWVRYAPERLSREDRKAGASLGKQWIWDSVKIVYRQTAPRIIAAVDPSGFAARNSVHSIVLRQHDDTVLHALCACLNSSSFRSYYQAQTGETRKVFPQVHVSSVKTLRVPSVLLDPQHDVTQRLAALARQVAVVVPLGGVPPDGTLVTDALHQIDAVVERLFASTWEEAERGLATPYRPVTNPGGAGAALAFPSDGDHRQQRPRRDDTAETSTVVLEYLAATGGWHGKAEVVGATGIDSFAWSTALSKLLATGQVERRGETRGAQYRATGGADE
ncbi:MAG: N-6 DNA methylase [Propionibacterium sp.]|nr:N-6 DNA methylase [Propionibacterium sp.]